MSPKHFTCFLGCIGGLSIALVTISIYRVPFLVSRCFRQDTCFIRLQSNTPDDDGDHTEPVHSYWLLFLPTPHIRAGPEHSGGTSRIHTDTRCTVTESDRI